MSAIYFKTHLAFPNIHIVHYIYIYFTLNDPQQTRFSSSELQVHTKLKFLYVSLNRHLAKKLYICQKKNYFARNS